MKQREESESEDQGDLLDPRFVVVERAARFFTVGRVFKTLWIQPAGNKHIMSSKRSYNTARYGQLSYSKIRPFVVIRKRLHSCLCLPISTYSGRGAGKGDARDGDHAAVYSSTDPVPVPLPQEKITINAFPIIVEENGERIAPMSRINFGKIYTVEHNVKVLRIGRISPEHLKRFDDCFADIMGLSQQMAIIKPLSTVPFCKDIDFTGREDILAVLDTKFSLSKSHTRVALVGLGGTGKSQIAIEYSHRIRDISPQTWVFWVCARSAAQFEQSYKQIANVLFLPERDDEMVDTLQLVSQWLRDERNGPWFLILDGADDVTMFIETVPESRSQYAKNLSAYIPQSATGSIIVTSRDSRLAYNLIGDYNYIIRLGPMRSDEALGLLNRKLNYEAPATDGQKLLETLSYLPLAITQAAAYISAAAPWMNTSKYLELCNKDESSHVELLSKDAGDARRDSQVSNSIMITWQTSFNQIEKINRTASDLLSLMSVLGENGIPEYLLLMENINQLSLDAALSLLLGFSLITSETGGHSFEMHRLVRVATKYWLEQRGVIRTWNLRALRLLSRAFMDHDYQNQLLHKPLLPHVETILSYSFNEEDELLEMAHFLHNVSLCLLIIGQYQLSATKVEQALEIKRLYLKKTDADLLSTVELYGQILISQGKYNEAEPLQREVFTLRETRLGKEHPDTLISINNLATLLQSQGKYVEAEHLEREVFSLMEKLVGKEHPNTLTTMNDLALSLQYQGRFGEAELLQREVAALREKVLGTEHPDTISSSSSIANLLQLQGRINEAEPLQRKVLAQREKVLGVEHPTTLNSMSNLAVVLQSQGKYSEAEPLQRKVLLLMEKVLGKEHPYTLNSITGLATSLENQGNYSEAETLYWQVLGLSEKAVGKRHPHTEKYRNVLAELLKKKGRHYEANKLLMVDNDSQIALRGVEGAVS